MTTASTFAGTRSDTQRGLTPISWQENRRIPPACAAILDTLKFTTVAPRSLPDFSKAEWQQALRFCDESRLTLLAGETCGDKLPSWVGERIRRNLLSNITRMENLRREYVRIANSLEAASVEHVVLKGFAHGPEFGVDIRCRPQYDLDLWCREPQLDEARSALAQLGLESVAAQERFPTGHLPPMIRKTGWDWKGDYFDAEMPPVVELHFALWDERIERLAAPGLDEFWGRSRREQRAGMTVPVMHLPDQFAFATLHAVRHLLRGDLRALHVYEIAHFLHAQRDDGEFWAQWKELHAPELRRLQSLACGLARKWFACSLPDAVAAEIHALPRDVHTWFENYAASAVESKFVSSKDELWLHLALLSSLRAKAAVVRRRMIPLNLPGRVESEFVPGDQRTVASRLIGAIRYAAFFVARAMHHLRSWGAFLSGGTHWWRLRRAGRKFPDAQPGSTDVIAG
jgi:hypothetical protein